MSETTAATVPAIFIRRTFKAPRERVFAAWTDVAQLLAWFGPPGAPVIVQAAGFAPTMGQGMFGPPAAVGGA